MAHRYTDKKSIGFNHFGALEKLLLAAFQEREALKSFIRKKLGGDVEHSVGWEQALTYACDDLIRYCESNSSLGRLLESLQSHEPPNRKLDELIAGLVREGYLEDNQQITPSNLGQHSGMYRLDQRDLDSSLRATLAIRIGAFYHSTDALADFVLNAVPGGFGAQYADEVLSHPNVEDAAYKVVEACSGAKVLTAFLAALESAHPGVQFFKTCLDFMTSPPPVASAPLKPQPPAPPPVNQPRPATSRSPDEKVVVAGVSRRLPGDQMDELLKFFVDLLRTVNDIMMFCRIQLDENMEGITSRDKTPVMALRIVEWCVDENKMVELLNGLMTTRPHRSDFKEFVRNLADAGFVQLAL